MLSTCRAYTSDSHTIQILSSTGSRRSFRFSSLPNWPYFLMSLMLSAHSLFLGASEMLPLSILDLSLITILLNLSHEGVYSYRASQRKPAPPSRISLCLITVTLTSYHMNSYTGRHLVSCPEPTVVMFRVGALTIKHACINDLDSYSHLLGGRLVSSFSSTNGNIAQRSLLTCPELNSE